MNLMEKNVGLNAVVEYSPRSVNFEDLDLFFGVSWSS